MIEISWIQDEEVGDGIILVIIFVGEMLFVVEYFLEQQMYLIVVISVYCKVLDDMISILKKISILVDISDSDMMLNIINSFIIIKVISWWLFLVCNIVLDVVKMVQFEENGWKEIDIKKYVRVEKIFGGIIEDFCVLCGVMINKDVIYLCMWCYIKNFCIVLLDFFLEYKKGESQIDIEII